MKRVTPKQMLEISKAMAENIERAKHIVVAVGLPKGKAAGAVYGDGRSVVQNAATHEYGASFTHPGGTGYIIGKGGKAVFVKTSRGGKVAGITKPHNITIPQRSFLRVPFKVKAKFISKSLAESFQRVFEDGVSADLQLEKIGALLQNISKMAFENKGYGTWKELKAATKRAKGSSSILFDTGILVGSITYEVRDAT